MTRPGSTFFVGNARGASPLESMSWRTQCIRFRSDRRIAARWDRASPEWGRHRL